MSQLFNDYTLRQDKIYIIPSRLGFIFTGIMFSLFIIGLSYGNNLTLSVAFILFTYFVLQMLTTHKNLAKIQPRRISFENNYAHTPIEVTIDFDETRRIDNDFFELAFAKNIFPLEVKNSTFTSRRLLKRGVYQNDYFKLSNRGQSGLFYAWKFIKLPFEFYVYPAPEKYPTNNLFDYKESAHATEENEFHQHSPYSPGESSKRIDWKVFARTDLLYQKKFTGADRGTIKLDFNTLQGSIENRLSILSFLLQNTYKKGQHWSLHLPHKILKDQYGLNHLEEALKELARYPQQEQA